MRFFKKQEKVLRCEQCGCELRTCYYKGFLQYISYHKLEGSEIMVWSPHDCNLPRMDQIKIGKKRK